MLLCGFYAHVGKYLKVLQGALPHTAMVSAVHSQRLNLFIDRRVVEELQSQKKGGEIMTIFRDSHFCDSQQFFSNSELACL